MTVKLSKEDLRRIVRETIKRKFDLLEAEIPRESNVDLVEAYAAPIIAALIDTISYNFEEIVTNAFDSMMETYGDDDVPVVGRIEDLNHWAVLAAEQALSDRALTAHVADVTRQLMKMFMTQKMH